MKYTAFLFLCFIYCTDLKAQITGSDTVCASYIYSYSVTVPGATTYNWTVPAGWNVLHGQGTSQINAFCNVNTGNVCVIAFDTSGNLLSQQCLTVQWGGGNGWNTDTVHFGPCMCDPIGVTVVPNSSGCPGSCGSGIQSPNTFFAVYDNPWPFGNYVCRADGTVHFTLLQPGQSHYYYVYLIDTTFGMNNAVRITGGCSSTVNNGFLVSGCSTITMSAIVSPDTACVGDTVDLIVTSGPGISGAGWSVNPSSANILSMGMQGQAVILSSNPSFIQFVVSQTDANNCMYNGFAYVIVDNCSSVPISLFHANDTVICQSTCVSFSNQSQFADSCLWLFPGANVSSDTARNPHNICYPDSGTFDVTLITYNQNGVDTLTLYNYITVIATNFPPLSFNGDTIFAGNSFVSYQWAYYFTAIQGATSSYYVPQNNGAYSVNIVDSNGCYTSQTITGITISQPVSYFHSNDTLICPSGCVNFINQSLHSDSSLWLFPGANIASDTSADPQNVCYSNPGSYDVTLITYNHSGTDTLTIPHYINVSTFNFSPLSFNGDTLFADNNYVSYQWYYQNTVIPGAINYYYIPAISGNYSVYVVDSNGCDGTSFLQGVILTSAELNPDIKISAFYDGNNLTIDCSDCDHSGIRIEVNDITGRRYFLDNLTNDPQGKIIQIPLILQSGIYIINIFSPTDNYSRNFIVR
jgi:PKD repeat protein